MMVMETKNKRNQDVAMYQKRKGDTLFYIMKDYRKDEIRLTLTVTKVTLDFIYAVHKNTSYQTKFKFNIHNGLEIVNYGSIGHAYSSENYYNTYLKICYPKADLSNRVNSCYDYYLLLKIKKLLDNNVPNNEIIEIL